MTRDDTKRILDRICRLYITQAKKLSVDNRVVMLDTWQDVFRHDSYDEVNEAVSRYVSRGSVYMPDVSDIVKELSAVTKASATRPYTETDKLFKRLVDTADMLVNNKERISTIDPGGFKWNEDLQRKTYFHAETRVSTTSFTQYDFKQLPDEIQEYAEDIEGLKALWPEIESSRELARRRFEAALPDIKAELEKRRTVSLADMWSMA